MIQICPVLLSGCECSVEDIDRCAREREMIGLLCISLYECLLRLRINVCSVPCFTVPADHPSPGRERLITKRGISLARSVMGYDTLEWGSCMNAAGQVPLGNWAQVALPCQFGVPLL